MKTADSHIAAARYYTSIGMMQTARRELARAQAARQRESSAPAPFKPSQREAMAMRAALAAFRKY